MFFGLKEKFLLFLCGFKRSNRFKFKEKKKITLNNSNLLLYAFKFVPTIIFALFSQKIVYGLIFGLIWWFLTTMFFDHRFITEFRPTIRVWFGVPGSGKTTLASYISKHSIKQGYTVLSNVDIKGTYKLNCDDLGKYDTSFNGNGAHVVIDEGSLEFDNRNFKTFAQTTKPLYFSLHRHMNNRVDVFSQGFDIDKRIRDRIGNNGLFYIQKVGIPYFVMYRRINKILYIKKEDKQIIDGYEFKGLPRFIFTPPLWKLFDTRDLSLCPKMQKQWKKW